YGRKLTVAEGFERIETIYKPYHDALRSMITRTVADFGVALLVDCHSMPSTRTGNIRRTRPDFVLGDRYSTSCMREIIWAAAEILSGMGYAVEINKPYAGGFITEHYGRPHSGVHAF